MNRTALVSFSVVLILSIFPLFSHLDTLPMQRWDEARLSTKAYEMYQNGNWIVPHHGGAPDMWSTKPPLMIWLQVLSFKVFGVSTLAARIPSAVAALFTVILILWFYAKRNRTSLTGVIAALILITTGGLGYVSLHGSRTGDYDSLLTLCTTAYLLLFYNYMSVGKPKYILLSAMFIILAALTKGVQGLIFLPAMIIMAVLFKQLGVLLKTKEFYIGLIAFILLVPGYYLLREHYNPGYIKTVFENEWGGRAFNTLEGHVGGPLYYLNHIVERGMSWFPLVPVSVLFAMTAKGHKKRFTGYLFCVVTFYCVMISIAQTKLYWYLMPVYPLLAMMIAEMLEAFFKKASDTLSRNNLSSGIVTFFLLIAFFIYPYRTVLKQVARQQGEMHSGSYMTAYLYSIERGEREGIVDLNFLNSDYEQDVYWYHKSLKDKYSWNLKNVHNLKHGDKVILFKEETDNEFRSINKKYNLLKAFYNVKVYEVLHPSEGL